MPFFYACLHALCAGRNFHGRREASGFEFHFRRVAEMDGRIEGFHAIKKSFDRRYADGAEYESSTTSSESCLNCRRDIAV
jgi:hypothetical protein